MEDLIDVFESTHQGLQVECTPVTNMTSIIGSEMQNPTYDVYISHGINWQQYAEAGYLVDMDDVYASEVSEGKTFEDLVIPEARSLAKLKTQQHGEHYWKVSLTKGAGGFIYNVDMFEEHGWEVPNTYDELVKLCAEISAAGIAPFTWSGSGTNGRDYYWDYVMYSWWRELEGDAGWEQYLSMKNGGKYADGWKNFGNENFKQAFKMWYDLVALNKNYSYSNPLQMALNQSQGAFVNKQAAMIPYAQWAKNEIENGANSGNDLSFDIAMMPTPTIKADSPHYNFMVGFGDSIIIPQNIKAASENIKNSVIGNAKEFVKFLGTADARKTFVEKADGPFLAFDYSDITFENPNTYVQSMQYLMSDEVVSFTTTSNNSIVYANTDTYVQPWANNQIYYASAFDNPERYTPEAVAQEVQNNAHENWRGWLRAANVSD